MPSRHDSHSSRLHSTYYPWTWFLIMGSHTPVREMAYVLWTKQQHKPMWGGCQMKATSSVVSTKVTRECNMVPVRQDCPLPSDLLKSASLTVMFIFIIHGILCFLYLEVKIDQLLTPTLCMHKNLTISQLII